MAKSSCQREDELRPSKGLLPFTSSLEKVSDSGKPSRGTQRSAGQRSSARRQRRIRQALAPVGSACQAEHQEHEAWTPSRCAETLARLEADLDSQLAAISSLHTLIWTLSNDRLGCRVVQQALKMAPRGLKDALVRELHGHVCDAIASPHANFVIQQVVEIMPVACAAFVAEELIGVAAQVARHRYGCRVIIRLLEHFATQACVASLVDELLKEAQELLRHSYGHFVLQAVLEHGLPCHRHSIAMALQGVPDSLLRNAMNRHASCVLEAALMYCAQDDVHSISAKLLTDPCKVLALAQSQFGCFVLKALLVLPGNQPALSIIRDAVPQLQASKAGRKTLDLLGFGFLGSV